MNTDEALISLLVMAGIIFLVGTCRQLAHRALLRRTPNWYTFTQELTATFQICACTHELCLLGSLLPRPQIALWLTYIFTVLHGWTLTGSVGNPASSIQQLYKGELGIHGWCLQTAAQFAAAVLAHLCMKFIWMLGFTAGHLRALPDVCSNPIQTSLTNAFGLEFLFSFLLHLTLLQFQGMNPTMKVHLIALLITSFVYAGGNLTGAVFNPALAFSLHGSCFVDQLWNYLVVYCIAPCAGSVFVSVIWDEVLPGLYRDI
ncbi:aquaporin-11 [Pantherophis guttatus]|uniref:Aquaporin-11 n=1 Tax=Pantherophis guttatus TaxID=94885 RepID=A0ABM3YXB0_PANGU|nr:aquaporin-11 [Pantherophis guttatus]XP_060540443.1 aquaporin-11 [Pantherophis guttatus]XP_060540752.1 aquaporin-11 [Pantherophis guttatus]XP_060540753.1 aquaporin-11 [Pantherophis guttatus]XP_060540754.1 aquaporin-11 [Pantherophis guttatus]XP_060540755.1 aquaporin-11 [Pantherophis guttatus]